MRNIIIVIFVSLFTLSAYAERLIIEEKPGFIAPREEIREVSVLEVLNNTRNDMRVVLKGRLLKRVSEQEYIFTDGTGEVLVEIPYRKLPYELLTPDSIIKIHGQVYKNYFTNRIEVEVKALKVL